MWSETPQNSQAVKNERQIHSAFSNYIRDGIKYPGVIWRKEKIQLLSKIIGLYVQLWKRIVLSEELSKEK